MAQINKPNEYFNTKLYSGDNATNKAITGVNFQPDLVWIKARTEVHQHNLFDVIRGVNKNLSSNLTSAEATDNQYGYLASYDTDGFTTQKGSSSGQWNVNETGENYVAWNWLASNTTASNTNGSITSTVSANTTSGFSIVSYTGTGSTATVGHGLSQTPEMIIVKLRSGSGTDWITWGSILGGTVGSEFIKLNLTGEKTTGLNSSWFNNTAPTSSVFTVGTQSDLNGSGSTYIGYCFHSVKGYSKFGRYTGNGSTDGTFVYTGFKPAFVMIKSAIGDTGQWVMYDTARDTYNAMDLELQAESSNAEDALGSNPIDCLSNGFKIRSSTLRINKNTSTFIYMAFAEQPLVGTNNIPATAR